MSQMLTAQQVADLLGTRRNTVYELAAAGALPSLKIPGVGRRFKAHEVEAWLEQFNEPARPPAYVRRPGNTTG